MVSIHFYCDHMSIYVTCNLHNRRVFWRIGVSDVMSGLNFVNTPYHLFVQHVLYTKLQTAMRDRFLWTANTQYCCAFNILFADLALPGELALHASGFRTLRGTRSMMNLLPFRTCVEKCVEQLQWT